MSAYYRNLLMIIICLNTSFGFAQMVDVEIDPELNPGWHDGFNSIYRQGTSTFKFETNYASKGEITTRTSYQTKWLLICNEKMLAQGKTPKGYEEVSKIQIKLPKGICSITFKQENKKWPVVNVYIDSVKQTRIHCSHPKFEITDTNGVYTRGNGDGKLSPFEQMKLDLSFKTLAESSIDLEVQDSQNLAVLSQEKVRLGPEAERYSVWVTVKRNAKLNKDTKELKLSAVSGCGEHEFTIPYLHQLGDEIIIDREAKVIKRFNAEDKTELDNFIRDYSESEYTAIFFAQRMKLLDDLSQNAKGAEQINHAIDEYHSFINIYPNTAGAQVAIHNSFQLYKKLDTIPKYDEFIKRYPHSIQSHLAREQIKLKLYKQAIKENKLEVYDEFIKRYPKATPYVNKIIQRANELFVEHKLRELNSGVGGPTEKRLRILSFDLYDEWVKLASNSNPLSPLLVKAKLQRIEAVFKVEPFKYSDAKMPLETKKDLEEIKDTLSKITKLIEDHHQESQKSITEGFAAMRKELKEGFKGLQDSLTGIEQRLKQVEDEQQSIHSRINSLNSLVNSHVNQVKKSSGDLVWTALSMLPAVGGVISGVKDAYDLYKVFKS